MAIDGLIIIDNGGRPIIQSGFRSTSQSYPLLHIDALNNALSKSPSSVDPVIYVPQYSTSSATACCHVQCGDIRILCPVSGDVDPLFAFAFIQTFTDILSEYFGNVSATTLKENFDVVYQLLEETLDSGGHPLTTSSNALRDIVLPPSLLTKLLNVAGANITSTINSGSGLGSGPFSSPIPWRKAGIRYTSNEIYFDVVEELKATVNKLGTTLNSAVWGKIETNSRLSGLPDCRLTLTNSKILTDCAFHPCVRLKRWTESKVLSFVPPDGRFVLAEYRYAPDAMTTTPSAPTLARDHIPIPFTLKIAFDIENTGGSFDIQLTSRLTTRDMEHVVVELRLGEGASGSKCATSRAGAADRYGRGEGVGASWSFDSNKKILRWEIPVVSPSSCWILRGSFSSNLVSGPRPSRALQVRFEIQSHTFSAIKVEQVKVTGEAYKLYKGVRGRSVGNVEWRWFTQLETVRNEARSSKLSSIR